MTSETNRVNVVDNYVGSTTDDVAALLRTVIAQQKKLLEEVDSIKNHLEEKDARRRNQIIRRRIPAPFMREK